MDFLGRGRRLVAAIVIAAFFALSIPAMAQGQDSGRLQLFEQTIKAGLVYNFLKYTTWPESPASGGKNRLKVCLLGGDPLEGYLSAMEGRTAQQAVITIVRMNDVHKTADCSVVFISRKAADDFPALLDFLKNRPVLTISDIDDFARKGGMVELAMEDQRVALRINKQAIDRTGLTIQDRLLRLAKLASE